MRPPSGGGGPIQFYSSWIRMHKTNLPSKKLETAFWIWYTAVPNISYLIWCNWNILTIKAGRTSWWTNWIGGPPGGGPIQFYSSWTRMHKTNLPSKKLVQSCAWYISHDELNEAPLQEGGPIQFYSSWTRMHKTNLPSKKLVQSCAWYISHDELDEAPLRGGRAHTILFLMNKNAQNKSP